MKNAICFCAAALFFFALFVAVPTWASTKAVEDANQLLLEATGDALEYVYTGNSNSRDIYLQKMKKVDQAIAAFAQRGDTRMAAVLKKRRDRMDQAARKMFNGYEDNDADLGLQVKAFQDATDDLDGTMQDVIDGQDAYDGGEQAIAEQYEFLAEIIKYQMALRMAGMRGVEYASGGSATQKQEFDDAMAKLESLAQKMKQSAAKAGFDKDPRFAKLLGVMDGARHDFADAAATAFSQREASGKADAATLNLFKQAEEKLLTALDSE